jgi:hypothetical protein
VDTLFFSPDPLDLLDLHYRAGICFGLGMVTGGNIRRLGSRKIFIQNRTAMRDELIAFRMSVRGGATEAQLILEQQILGIIKLLRSMDPYYSAREIETILRYANNVYQDYGEFGIRSLRGGKRSFFFTYKQF